MRKHHRGAALLILIVIAFAFYLRWDAISASPDIHIERFEETYRVDVGEPGPWFSAWAMGDGQAYALIGIDPTGRALSERIHEAGYRFARAGFGWAVWAVSLGQDEAVPYALAIVGALCMAGVLAFAVGLRSRLGLRSWLIVLNPALFIGLAADTSEPMGILLLTAALAGGGRWAVGLLGVTRPTFLVALWGRWGQLALGVSAAVLLGIYGLVVFGIEAMIPSGGRLGFPFHAYFEHPSVLGVLLGVAAIVTVAHGAHARTWSWVLAGLFVLCFGTDVLRDPLNAWRAAGFLPVIWAFGGDSGDAAGPDGGLHSGHVSADVA